MALFALSVLIYSRGDASWWLFAALFLLPDLGMLGYLRGPRIGAACYNLTHTLVGPLLFGVLGVSLGSSTSEAVALIWAAHIGLDRGLGYGLKYCTNFRDTHLQRIAG